MQKFTKITHKKFINHYKIKKTPSEIDKKLLQKTQKYLNFVKWIPWLRMIWVWNSVSMNYSTKKSDIDLFIVTTQNSMWLNRALITLIFQIIWQRKTKNKHQQKFCLSFFSSIEGLNFNSWKLKQDIYLYFRIIYFKPILNYNNTYSLFLSKNSSWANFDDYSKIIETNKTYIKYEKNIENIKDNFLIMFIDKLIKKILLKRTLNTQKKLKYPFWVIINDNLLKFHDKDIRKKIRNKLLINT